MNYTFARTKRIRSKDKSTLMATLPPKKRAAKPSRARRHRLNPGRRSVAENRRHR